MSLLLLLTKYLFLSQSFVILTRSTSSAMVLKAEHVFVPFLQTPPVLVSFPTQSLEQLSSVKLVCW